MSSDAKQNEESYEPSPTSPPPIDVEIPVETVYGDNTPMPPVEEPEQAPEEQSDKDVSKKQNTSKPSSLKKSQSSEGSGKSIKIGWITVLFFLLLYGGGLFVLGSIYKEQFEELTAQISQTETPESKDNKTEDKDTQKNRKTINFVRDLGAYKKENTVNAEKLVARRANIAKKSIVWITAEPNNNAVLSVLASIKNKIPIPIFIVTDSETEIARIRRAEDFGFTVNQFNSVLEVPYSILLIDDKILMDISRDNWVWETTDKTIITETAKWANDLIKDSKIVDKRIN